MKLDDLISRAAARDIITDLHGLCRNDVLRDTLAKIDAITSVDAAPVMHGRWMHLDPRERATISGKCSHCGWEAHYYEDDVADMPYCQNCGAKMDTDQNLAYADQSGAVQDGGE